MSECETELGALALEHLSNYDVSSMSYPLGRLLSPESGLGTRDSGLGTRDSGLGTRDSGAPKLYFGAMNANSTLPYLLYYVFTTIGSHDEDHRINHITLNSHRLISFQRVIRESRSVTQ